MHSIGIQGKGIVARMLLFDRGIVARNKLNQKNYGNVVES